jgi:hypothetical protein
MAGGGAGIFAFLSSISYQGRNPSITYEVFENLGVGEETKKN